MTRETAKTLAFSTIALLGVLLPSRVWAQEPSAEAGAVVHASARILPSIQAVLEGPEGRVGGGEVLRVSLAGVPPASSGVSSGLPLRWEVLSAHSLSGPLASPASPALSEGPPVEVWTEEARTVETRAGMTCYVAVLF